MHDLINRVEQYPMTAIVAQYAKDEKLSLATAEAHERELKRFLALVCLKPSGTYEMRGPVDKLWHKFIIYTLEYQKFCENMAGRFIHHIPDCVEDRLGYGSVNRYVRFLDDYKSIYGEEPPAHLWPSPDKETNGEACSDPVD